MTDRDAAYHALAHLTTGPGTDIVAQLSLLGKSREDIDKIYGRKKATTDHYLKQIKSPYWKGQRETKFEELWDAHSFSDAYELLQDVHRNV